MGACIIKIGKLSVALFWAYDRFHSILTLPESIFVVHGASATVTDSVVSKLTTIDDCFLRTV